MALDSVHDILEHRGLLHDVVAMLMESTIGGLIVLALRVGK